MTTLENPPVLDDRVRRERLALLREHLGTLPGLVVAYSGGVDSAFLLAAAVRVLGAEKVLAATAYSGSLAGVERGPATDFADSLGVEQWTPTTHEIEREGYRANAGDRCYFCKTELFEVFTPEARRRGWPVATGTNADDAAAGFRPGIRAGEEHGALTPLRDAGLTKDDIRATAAEWGLPSWDKPAAACLASRIAYGLEVTPHRLARVERAEDAIRTILPGVRDLRVRDMGDHGARIELDNDTLAQVGAERGARLETAMREEGFDQTEVTVFRSGSMNDLLEDPDKYR